MFGASKTEKMLDAVAKVAGDARMPPQQATFSLPVTHPAADALRKLMIHLQTASETPSGLRLQHREDDPAAVEEMLDALHRVLKAEGVEVPLLSELVRKQREHPSPLTMPHLFLPQLFAALGSIK